MQTPSADTVVIGAGVIGLAIARALARSGRDVLVLERHAQFGSETSSRNSEVIHAGLYYPLNSLKARFCTAGRDALYPYCESHQVPHRQCGKWLLAADEEQVGQLETLRQKAQANGVDLQPVPAHALAAVPELTVKAALASPLTGIIDSHRLMLALLGGLEDAGGRVVYRAPVLGAAIEADRHRLRIGGEMACELDCMQVINAAGLQANDLARHWDGFPVSRVPELYLARGHYFSYQGRHPFNRLMYPIPEPGGLGIHLTLDMAGQARFGPDVQWIDEVDYTVPPDRLAHFVTSIQRWWPDVEPDRLHPAYAGIRPKLSGPGEPAADFRIETPADHGVAGLVHLFGMESPGLTASLAIADYVVEALRE